MSLLYSSVIARTESKSAIAIITDAWDTRLASLIEKIAEGRVWTGTAAKELGLVDELGGLDKALEIAAQKAEVDAYSIINYPSQDSFFSSLLNEGKDDYINGKMQKVLGESYSYIKFIENLKDQDRIQARMPFDLRIQ
jgi:protease-4